MRGDPVVALLIIAGGAIICLVFIPHWSQILRHNWSRVWAWAAEPCPCNHCAAARQLVAEQDWQRFVDEHAELHPRNRAAS